MKAAFTRAYNKESHLLPYAPVTAVKKGRRGNVAEDMGEDYDQGETQDIEEKQDSDEDISKDMMVKVNVKVNETLNIYLTQNICSALCFSYLAIHRVPTLSLEQIPNLSQPFVKKI